MTIVETILGDISGSQYEFTRPQDLDYKVCDRLTDNCRFTGDTVMPLEVALQKNFIMEQETFAQ